MTRSVLLTIAYDGTPYSGLVVQTNARTVGGELLRAIRRLDPTVDKLRVASRTDAGVHARQQRVCFDTEATVPNRAWVRGLLPYLPDAIVVLRATTPRNGFNPRFETVRKRYRYLLLCQHRGDPFLASRAWRVGPLPKDAVSVMRRELASLEGHHDFAGFASSRDERMHTHRTMEATDVVAMPGEAPVIAIDITGDGFLHNMVRIIVGSAVDVARGRLEPGAIGRALVTKNRADLGVTAPPDGLYLEYLELSDEGTDAWPPATPTALDPH